MKTKRQILNYQPTRDESLIKKSQPENSTCNKHPENFRFAKGEFARRRNINRIKENEDDIKLFENKLY